MRIVSGFSIQLSWRATARKFLRENARTCRKFCSVSVRCACKTRPACAVCAVQHEGRRRSCQPSQRRVWRRDCATSRSGVVRCFKKKKNIFKCSLPDTTQINQSMRRSDQIRSDQMVVRPFPKNENKEKRRGVCTQLEVRLTFQYRARMWLRGASPNINHLVSINWYQLVRLFWYQLIRLFWRKFNWYQSIKLFH